MPFEIVQVQSSALPTGAATEATAAGLSAKLPASLGEKTAAGSLSVVLASDQPTVPIAGVVAISGTVPVGVIGTVPVSGPLTDTQLRASAVPVSGTVTATGPLTDTQLRASAVPVSGPLTDTQLRAAAVPVSAAALPLPTGAATQATLASIDAGIPAALGQTTMAGSMPVALASDQPAVPVSIAGTVTVTGTVTDGQLPASLGQKLMAGSMSVALASDQPAVPVSGPLTDTQLRAAPVPVSGPLTDAQLRTFAATLWVTATGAANAAVTATLPAPGVGLFHYITSIRVSKLYAVVGVANAAGVVITSSNLPGNPAWTTEQAAGALGTCPKVVDEVCGLPIKSLAANVATTINCPAQTQTVWRVNVTYYTGP